MEIRIRKLEFGDMHEVIELLKNNMSNFAPDESEYPSIWHQLNLQNNVYGLIAFANEQVVGYASVFIETKIRGGKVAHIEDVVSHNEFRRLGIGSKLLSSLLDIAIEHNCYKIVLVCELAKVDFYFANGYIADGVSMSRLIK